MCVHISGIGSIEKLEAFTNTHITIEECVFFFETQRRTNEQTKKNGLARDEGIEAKSFVSFMVHF